MITLWKPESKVEKAGLKESEKISQKCKTIWKSKYIYYPKQLIMQLGLHISHLPLLANEPMAFCVYSDRERQDINKWTGPGPRCKR